MLVAGGSTNVTTYFAMRLAADGTGATGLTITGFDLQYVRSGAAPSTKADATALAATDSAHGDNQAIEVDSTDAPGLYRVDWPDAAFAAGAREVILTVKVATCFTEHLRCEIDGEVNVVEWAGTDVVAGAIPAVAADGVGGLIISDAGGLDADAMAASVTAIEVDTSTTLDGKIDTIDANVDAILVDTGEIGAAGAGLTAINLPNQTMDIVGSITGNLSGSVGSVTGAVGSVTGAVGSVTGNVGGVAGTITTLDALDTAQDTQHSTTQTDIATAQTDLDTLTDARGEPAQSAPGVSISMLDKIDFLYKAWRNKATQTATEYKLFADDTTTVDHKATVADDGTTFTRGEQATGP